jgi:malonyl CoA-acyl carrier protein transacylase
METNLETEVLSPTKRALLAVKEMKAKLEDLERTKNEPIAIIGMGCRFPGANSPMEFWELLRDGRDAIGEVPKERWDINAYYDPNPDAPGKMSTRFGGFLERVDEFDPTFFNISPREAVSLDPQQRLLLEVSWEAIENSGLMQEKLPTKTGVFVGISDNDYFQLLLKQGFAEIDSYLALGNDHSTASGRLSYFLGLTGPCLSVNTACSSSLVGVHLACQSLRNSECDLALAGGVNLILTPELSINFSKARMLSPDGRCKTFDATANGYVRAEGCGVILLKRLKDAQADGDRILAVIRGSAINQDGHTSGLTVPHGPSQQAVIQQALENGSVNPTLVSYVEAHGTGTSLGDPIEVGALGSVFGQRQHPLWLGSVKTNIGHLESAAGIASLIKVVLSLKHGEIPPSLHFQVPNPHINWDELPVRVVTERTPWLSESRIAGVSSFGFSGTNAHVVLEEAPKIDKLKAEVERPLHLLCLSAKTQEALLQLASRYEQHLAAEPNLELGDICFTANTGRSHFNYRLSVVASQPESAREKLAAFSAGQETIGVFQGRVNTTNKIAFLFTGQGSQYVGMGRQLYETQPTFREALDKCDRILAPKLEKPLLDVLYPQEGENLSSIIDETAYTQSALFALEYALFQLWKSWGLEPDVVMGHSVGEYVAACVAGVFSLEDGLKLIAERGRLMQTLPPGGEMVSVMASEQQIATLIQPYAQDISIGAINGPESVVISGQSEAINAVCITLEASGIKTKKLNVSHAFHSPLMEPMLASFEKVARQVSFSSPQIKLISNVTGSEVTKEVATPEYWCRHIRQPVRFACSMKSLEKQGVEVLVEIGPKPLMLGMGRLCLPEHKGLWLASLRPEQDDWQQLLTSLAQLYVRGVPLNWVGFDQDYSRRREQLPTYPFQRQRYWIQETDRGNGFKAVFQNNSVRSNNLHPLLGQQLYLAGSQEIRFESQISQNSPAWIKDHRVFSSPILPGTAYFEIALAAGAVIAKSDNLCVEDVVIQQAMPLRSNEVKTVQVILTPQESGIYSFKIYSLSCSADETNSQPSWTLHTSGKLLVKEKEPIVEVDLAAMRAQCTQEIPVEQLYQWSQEHLIDYGPSFLGLEQVWRHSQGTLGKVNLVEELAPEAGKYQLHPVLLDTCLNVLGEIPSDESQRNTYVPVGLDRLRVWGRPGKSVWCHAQLRKVEGQHQQNPIADFRLFTPQGELIAVLEGLQLMHARREAMLSIPQQSWKNWLYEVEWRPQVSYGLTPDYMPSPQEVCARLQSHLVQLMAQPIWAVYGEALAQLEVLSVAYIVCAFQQMGWEFQHQERFSTAQIASQLGVVSQHQQLLGRLLEILAEVGILRRIDEHWEVVLLPEIQDPQEAIASLSCPEAEAEITLLGRCGPRLAQVLRGECDPLQLLFSAADTTTLTQLYQDSPMARLMNSLVQEAVLSAQERLPQGRSLRILEIGAGTGSTTNYILPHLFTERTEYIFTDIGAFFTAKAQEKFKDYPFVRYQVLDIEQDPQTQGFSPHQYDVIVAANVLHATSDLRSCLHHVKQLLAPGGMLVLLEDTAPVHWVDLTFGLTEGWWKFSDRQLRPDYPLLRASQWETLLQEIGFEQAVTISPDDVDVALQKVCLPSAVIVAFAKALPEVVTPKNWLLMADGQGVGQQLGVLLRSQGQICTLVFPGTEYEQIAPNEFRIDPANPKHLQQLFEALPGVTAIVHLWSLDTKTALTVDDLAAASKLSCGSTLHLVQALIKTKSSLPYLWLVTRGAQAVQGHHLPGIAQSPLWGMGKVIALEHPELKCTLIDLDPHATGNDAQNLFEEILKEEKENQVAFRDSTRYAARLLHRRPIKNLLETTQLEIPEDQPFCLEVSQRGSIDNLQLQKTTRRQPGAGEVEIWVRAAGLNFRDVLNALGLYPGEPPLGSECAGVVVAVGAEVEGIIVGDPVVALANGSFSQYVTVNANLVIPKPAALTFEEAVTIPVAFLTAYWCLHRVAKIAPLDRVLIHAATGGVGQAAVQLALQAGAEVFGTTSPSKWQVLKFLGIKYVMNSRTLDFAEEVMAYTNGQGVDIVLNSLTGEGFIQKSLEVLSEQGRFIELAKRDIWSTSQVASLRPDVSYSIVDLAPIEQEQPALIASLLRQLMQQFESGSLQPLAQTVFPIQEAVSAFRYMQQAKHTGKIIITFPEQVKAQQPVTVRGDGSYLITGGLGGLGLLVARWLVERGAKNLVLVGRNEPSSQVKSQLRELESQGAVVVVANADVADREQMALVLREIETSNSPLRGIIHAAGVLDDGIVLQQNWERFARVMNPKVQGAWNLHTLTQNKPIDFFVLFSSVASLLGSAGQANHSSANAFLDALAFYRRSQGLPGMSINWGAWSEVGAAARNQQAMKLDEKMGMEAIAPQQGLQVLEQLLREAPVQVGVAPINWSQFFKRQMASWSFFQEVTPVSQEPSTKVPTKLEFRQVLEQAPVPERKTMLASHVSSQVTQVLGLKGSESIDWTCGFFALGMDSLSSIELRHRLQTTLGCSLPSTLTIDYPTVEALVTYLMEEVFPEVFTTVAHKDAEALAPTSVQMQQLSESEAEALLIKKLENLNF